MEGNRASQLRFKQIKKKKIGNKQRTTTRKKVMSKMGAILKWNDKAGFSSVLKRTPAARAVHGSISQLNASRHSVLELNA
ncbi:hypothetical protein NDU88_007199 [Pleurodeles waltl]|uniref:Uncharacterized protein n=1 Tax=Pleurodeles waltl TaxID=8319 RepID=A0AAV7SRU5_PLEWA|nr:hypothetical protein NDU88_007199 [Pleurodeles waltl]